MQDERRSFDALQDEVTACRACPRLVAWRERVARDKRRAFEDWTYWGRPVPSFGEPTARMLVLGLAPAAHGGNRTGRMFTGDDAGDWLFRALYRAGFANRPTSRSRDDGLLLTDTVITAPVRCAPPGNKPTAAEFNRCRRRWLVPELGLLPRLELVVALGGAAWAHYFRAIGERGWDAPSPRPGFGHLAVVEEGLPHVLLGSYHPSRYNTNTGRLTEGMLDAVFEEARRRLDG
ncbi:MAG: uracil-DNA glycosylase [Myxococcota bacterium]